MINSFESTKKSDNVFFDCDAIKFIMDDLNLRISNGFLGMFVFVF
jgi:hypothetical protein